jgi:hypothetical protein
MEEVAGGWRKQHNQEVNNPFLYFTVRSDINIMRSFMSFSPNRSMIKPRRLRWAGYVARMGEVRNAYKILVGTHKGKRQLRIQRQRWNDNIKMNLKEIVCEDMSGFIWLRLGQALVNMIMNIWGLENVIY